MDHFDQHFQPFAPPGFDPALPPVDGRAYDLRPDQGPEPSVCYAGAA